MTRLLRALLAALLIALSLAPASAHEVRPAYLEIQQANAAQYRIVWKQPTMGDLAVRLVPRLSNGWLERTPRDQYAAAGFLIREWTIDDAADAALSDSVLTIEGLEYTITDVLVRVRLLDGRQIEAIVRPENPRLELSLDAAATLPAFFVHGLEHIAGGVDHLLFVLGLLLIVRDRWMLLKAVTAFTFAHSITLATGVLGQITLPSAFVETLIALSILFLGVEVLRKQRGGSSLTIEHPWAAAFFFGLFHGMGFAGGLVSLGFVEQDLFAALLLFNLGVEAGQLVFVALVLMVGFALRRLRLERPSLQTTAPAYLIGIAGVYWTLQTGTALVGIG